MAERDPRPGGLSCRASRALLARDAADGAIGLDRLSGAEREQLEQHVAGCAACQTRLDQLATAVLSQREDEIPCAECGPALDDWLAGERAGEDPRSSMHRVAAHLAICPECSAELLALQEAWDALQAGTLPVPEHEPTFDMSFLRTISGPVASSTQIPEIVEEAAGQAVAGVADEPSAADPRPDHQGLAGGLSALLATLRSRFGQSARTASSPSGTPPSRRALGELLIPLGALALLLLFLLEVVRPGEPTTTEPGATVTTAPTSIATAVGGPTATPAGATPTVIPLGRTATPIGGIGPAAEAGSPTPDGSPTAESRTDESTSSENRKDSRDDDRDDDADAAPTAEPSPATGYPGPDPNAEPTSGYPGPPTSEAAPPEDATPEPGAGYPGLRPDPTAEPTDEPTSPPSPGGTPTAEAREGAGPSRSVLDPDPASS